MRLDVLGRSTAWAGSQSAALEGRRPSEVGYAVMMMTQPGWSSRTFSINCRTDRRHANVSHQNLGPFRPGPQPDVASASSTSRGGDAARRRFRAPGLFEDEAIGGSPTTNGFLCFSYFCGCCVRGPRSRESGFEVCATRYLSHSINPWCRCQGCASVSPAPINRPDPTPDIKNRPLSRRHARSLSDIIPCHR